MGLTAFLVILHVLAIHQEGTDGKIVKNFTDGSLRVAIIGPICFSEYAKQDFLERAKKMKNNAISYLFFQSNFPFFQICVPVLQARSTQEHLLSEIRMIAENVTDILSQPMVLADQDKMPLKFTLPVSYSSLGILSAKDKGEDYMSAAFLQCFNKDVWLSIALIMILSSLVRTITKKIMRTNGNILQQIWEDFGIIFSEGIRYQEVWSEKLLILNWALGTFFLMSIFSCVMTSVYTAHTENNIDTIEDILRRTDLEPMVVDHVEILLNPTTELMLSLKQRVEEKKGRKSFWDLYGNPSNMQKVRNKTAVIFDYISSFRSLVLRKHQDLDNWHLSSTTYGLNVVSFILRGGIDPSLLDKLNVIICRYLEMFPEGLGADHKAYGGRDPLEVGQKTDAEAKSLSLTDSCLVFLIWSVGLGISFTICVFEFFFSFCLYLYDTRRGKKVFTVRIVR